MNEIVERLAHNRLKEAKAHARNVFIEAMLESFDKQDDPLVGIFWYDVESDELFGVDSVYAEEATPVHSIVFKNKEVKTCQKLHRTLWTKQYHRGKDKRFSGDYTKVPRGRVFLVDDHFVVMTGRWIRQYPQVMDYILDEFQLPADTTQFKIDSHWDLGHGWSDEF